MKTFKYRIYPSKAQTTKLNQVLSCCQKLYNHFLEERIVSWKENEKSVSYHQQATSLPKLKTENPSLKNVHSQVLQNVAVRVDLAFQAFFRRVKAKQGKVGFPRFKSWSRYDSFTFPQSGFKVMPEKGMVRLSKIGAIKIKLHRPIEGNVKNCTVKKTATGKWFISFTCEVEPKPVVNQSSKVVGIDLGLESFATLSNGKQIPNPRFFRKEEMDIVNAQRKLSAQKKGTPERAKARKVVARVHERIKNKRHNFVHQISRQIVDEFRFIAAEDLAINNMKKTKYRCMNKSIGDAAWRMLLDCIQYKAEEAGIGFVKVNPAYTSQICSRCGQRERKNLSVRTHKCSCCGFTLHRDHNAAINILRLGMQSLQAASAD